jgi:hypothetical protein
LACFKKRLFSLTHFINSKKAQSMPDVILGKNAPS